MSRYMLSGKHDHVVVPESALPHQYAVDAARAAELRAEFQAIWEKWSLNASPEELEGWADTFAADHPEWLEDNAA